MAYGFAAAQAIHHSDGAFLELRAGSALGREDFARTEEGELVVSARALAVLRAHYTLPDWDIEPYYPSLED